MSNRFFIISTIIATLISIIISFTPLDSPQFLKSQSSQSIVLQKNVGSFLPYVLNIGALGLIVATRDYKGLAQYVVIASSVVGITYVAKKIFQRIRPNGKADSFPSGHAATSFAPTAFIHFRFGAYYALPSYIVGIFVSYSRVASNSHYISDIMASLLLSIMVARIIASRYQLLISRSQVSVAGLLTIGGALVLYLLRSLFAA
ncbi:Phosphatase PAP2 family protein [Candidatus Hepatincolaceae symbiont of Richtersius coronifer]